MAENVGEVVFDTGDVHLVEQNEELLAFVFFRLARNLQQRARNEGPINLLVTDQLTAVCPICVDGYQFEVSASRFSNEPRQLCLAGTRDARKDDERLCPNRGHVRG